MTELLEKRKVFFQKYILNKETITLEILEEIYQVCISDNKSQHDYFMVFFKLATDFLEISSDNIELLIKWVNLIDYKTLNFSNYDYTNLDVYLIRTLKIMALKRDDIFVKEMYFYHTQKRSEYRDSYYFVDYNYCIYLYNHNLNEEARNLFLELLKYRQDDYLIWLPIKNYDLDLQSSLIPMSLLFIEKLDMFSYNTLLSYINKCKLIKNPIYLKNEINRVDIQVLRDIITNLLISNNSLFNIESGNLKSISKGGNGFIYFNNKPYFIQKKYMKKHFQQNKNYFFYSYDSFDHLKKTKSMSAFIIKENL